MDPVKSNSSPLGLIFPLQAEADAVLGRRGWRRIDCGRLRTVKTLSGQKILCVQSGVGQGRTAAAVQYLTGKNVGALGCLGIGAGLDPRLKPGAVVMATEVLDSGMSQEPLRFNTDRNLGERIKRCLEAGGLPVFRGSLWTGVTFHAQCHNLFEDPWH